MKEKVLSVENCSMVFGGLKAVKDVSLHVSRGEIVALIGPNGAGKTTLFNCVTGVYKPTEGDIVIGREEPVTINGMKPDKINTLGLARTFQNIRLFPSMTALENIMIGRHSILKAGIWGAIFRNKSTVQEEKILIDDSIKILARLNLDQYANSIASALPYGAQRRLEIARALATEPFILLLDEPAAGMNPSETRELVDTIRQVRDEEGITILLIEHDMSLVMNISERIYVLDYGKLIAEGSVAEVRTNKAVIQAYLGE